MNQLFLIKGRVNFTLFINNKLSQIIIDYVNKNDFHYSCK